jgi:hypothetical protein
MRSRGTTGWKAGRRLDKASEQAQSIIPLLTQCVDLQPARFAVVGFLFDQAGQPDREPSEVLQMSDEPKLGENRGNAGKGRPKGSPNKTTAILKDAILAAAELAGGEGNDQYPGGIIGYLTTQAITNPASFLPLLGKVLPLQVAGDPDNPLQVVHRIERVLVRPSN